MRIQVMAKNCVLIFSVFFAFMLAFFLYRAAFVLTYIKFNLLLDFWPDIISAFILGIRVDAKMIAISLLPPLLINLIFAFRYKWCEKAIAQFILYYSIFAFFALTALNIINHYYYNNFSSYIDTRIFGVVHDGTSEVLLSIWADYPVIRGVIIVIITNLLFVVCYKKIRLLIHKHTIKIQVKYFAAGVFIQVLFFSVAARGTLSTFPLERNHLTVSTEAVINAATNNGPFAMFWAYRDYQTGKAITPATLQGGEASAQALGWTGAAPFSLSSLFVNTAENKFSKNHPPHVVVTIMESMGADLFRYDSPDFDVEGRFHYHRNNDYWFTNFVSLGNGTRESLEGILFNTAVSPLCDTPLSFIKFNTTAFKPFIDAGYDFIYVTAGSVSWANVGPTLLRQGAIKVVDQSAIAKMFPEANLGVWGVFDDVMFKAIYKILLEYEARHKPVLIIALSTSNHSPYMLPDYYKSPAFVIPESLNKRFLVSQERAKQVIANFRYSNNALGEFIDDIKKSPLNNNTLIAATGDHPLREILSYTPLEDKVYRSAVPLYLKIPQQYMQNTVYNNARFGSHRDILATLYNRALSNAPYLRFGNDLFSKNIKESDFMATNGSFILSSAGAIDLRMHPPKFLGWKTPLALRDGNITQIEQEQLNNVFTKYKLESVLWRWHIKYQFGLAK